MSCSRPVNLKVHNWEAAKAGLNALNTARFSWGLICCGLWPRELPALTEARPTTPIRRWSGPNDNNRYLAASLTRGILHVHQNSRGTAPLDDFQAALTNPDRYTMPF